MCHHSVVYPLSCATVVFIFTAIIAIAVWLVWTLIGLHPVVITDSESNLDPTSGDYCSPQYYGWSHKNGSCPVNPVHSPNPEAENGMV